VLRRLVVDAVAAEADAAADEAGSSQRPVAGISGAMAARIGGRGLLRGGAGEACGADRGGVPSAAGSARREVSNASLTFAGSVTGRWQA